MTAVTIGPAIAILNSVAGESESRSMRATPPNSQSVIPSIPIPLRIATKACPSSCSTIEAKKSRALATARPYGPIASSSAPSTSR